MASKVFKATTGLVGLVVNEHPHHHLSTLYKRILINLKKMPENSKYRTSTEQIVKYRLQLVESEKDVAKLEEKIGMGQIEEVIVQAQQECDLTVTMLKYEPWQPLVAQAPPNQWKWPV